MIKSRQTVSRSFYLTRYERRGRFYWQLRTEDGIVVARCAPGGFSSMTEATKEARYALRGLRETVKHIQAA